MSLFKRLEVEQGLCWPVLNIQPKFNIGEVERSFLEDDYG